MKTLLWAVALTAACAGPQDTTPEMRWARVRASADCAPWDGAATSVFLSGSATDSAAVYPSLRLTVYHDLESVSGARWQVGESGADAAAPVLCPTEGACTAATQGWIEFAPRAGDGALIGRYDVTFPGGQRMRGQFHAPVDPTRALCG
jgi:hypothetical protein